MIHDVYILLLWQENFVNVKDAGMNGFQSVKLIQKLAQIKNVDHHIGIDREKKDKIQSE